jgi:hypothetical protein
MARSSLAEELQAIPAQTLSLNPIAVPSDVLAITGENFSPVIQATRRPRPQASRDMKSAKREGKVYLFGCGVMRR